MSRLFLHAPDEDALDPEDVVLIRQLRPAGLLVVRYDWDSDKGAAVQVISLVRELGHRDLLVRFERRGDGRPIPDRNPTAWAQNCADRMAIYQSLRADGVALHCIPGNEMNLADPEGGHTDWERHAAWMAGFAEEWRQLSGDPLHLPAPARMPIEGIDWNEDNTSLRYWRAMRAAGVHLMVEHSDAHAYRGDFLRAIQECYGVLGVVPWVTEANGMPMSQAVFALDHGLARGVVWFIADWRNYSNPGQPRAEELPPDGVHMSLLKWPELREEWLALDTTRPIPEEVPTMPEPLRGVALHPVIFAVADEVADETVPQATMRTALLALAEAESGRRSDAIRRGRWPDVSAGWGQVIVAATPEYADAGYRWIGGKAQKPPADFIEQTITAYLDPWHMGRFSAARLKSYLVRTGGDILAALRFYNKPATGQVSAAIEANYQRGLAFATAYLAAEQPAPPPPPEAPPPSFVLGFAEKVAELGAEVVGAALENEHDADHNGHAIRHQRTANGELIYWKDLGGVDFFVAERRAS